MRVKQWLSVGVASALVGFAGLASAQTFEGTINGQPRSWHVLSQGGDSTVSISQQGNQQMVVVQGHAEDNYGIKGTLTINAPMQNGQPASAPVVMYFPNATIFPVYVAVAQQPGKFDIKLSDATAQSTKVTGSYQGKLFRQDMHGKAPDMNDSIDIDVKFDLKALNMQ